MLTRYPAVAALVVWQPAAGVAQCSAYSSAALRFSVAPVMLCLFQCDDIAAAAVGYCCCCLLLLLLLLAAGTGSGRATRSGTSAVGSQASRYCWCTALEATGGQGDSAVHLAYTAVK